MHNVSKERWKDARRRNGPQTDPCLGPERHLDIVHSIIYTIPRRIYIIPALLALCLLFIYTFTRSTREAVLSPTVPIEAKVITMAAPLKHLKVMPKDVHTATVIFLHVSRCHC